jgi:peptide subunit release factor 1 (eRF1)
VEHSEQVDGETLHLQRSAPGGWSQRRFQQRAENQWEDNAREVADQIAAIADEIGAELIVVAGDVRAKQFLGKHLPSPWVELMRDVEGGRDDWSLESITEESVRLEATVAAELTVSVLDRFAEAQGNGLAASDVDETLAALNERRVETLLVVDDSESIDEPDADAAAVGADDPAMISTEESAVEATGQEAEEAPLLDAAIHAALSGGATVRIVPAHAVPARLCAILRFRND